jgi:hypothetical protein
MRVWPALRVAGYVAALAVAAPAAVAQENYESWPVLRSTFPSTGGGGIMIKGYDPVVTGGKCVTTFMAVEPGPDLVVNEAEKPSASRDDGRPHRLVGVETNWRQ